MTVEYPDVEGGLRAYLRAHTDCVAVLGTRVWFARPDKADYPLAVVQLVGAVDDGSEAPIDQALVQIDIHGPLHANKHPDKATTYAAAAAVRQALYDLNRGDTTVEIADGNSVRLMGSNVQSSVYLPDPDNGRPRYAITAQITAARLVEAA